MNYPLPSLSISARGYSVIFVQLDGHFLLLLRDLTCPTATPVLSYVLGFILTGVRVSFKSHAVIFRILGRVSMVISEATMSVQGSAYTVHTGIHGVF